MHLLGQQSGMRSLKRVMRSGLGLLSVLALVVTGTAWADLTEAPRLDVAVPQTQVATIQFNSSSKAMLVNAVLNAKLEQTFIFDTGATYTAISRKAAQALGLDLTHTDLVTITTANGRIAVPKIRLKTLNVNGVLLQDVDVTVLDFPEGSGYGGLLGLSVIRRFHVTIDPQANTLVLKPV
ncbi:MAG: retropepsin-like aspartic protease [Vampirovibrionales bacterium]|nr:retropepsin-like aspartic protease [Vampirovibrionales bacterium]